MPTPAMYVDAPTITLARYGLFAAASVLTEGGDGAPWELSGIEYQSTNCAVASPWTIQCEPPFTNPAKTGTDKPSSFATPFGVYAGTACGSLGTLGVDDETRARAVLTASEQRTVEAVYESGSAGNTPLLADPDAELPAGAAAVSLLEGLAALEDYLGDNYGGVGVIHAPRAVNPYAANRNLIRADGAVLRTWLDTAWAFGAGYAGLAPGGAAPAAGSVWIYATGAVTIRRSAVYVPATGAATLNTTTNQVLLVAERTYLVSADCLPVAGVLVDLAAEV